MTAGKYFSKIIFQCKCFFSLLFIFNSFAKNACGNGRSGTAVFRENLVAILYARLASMDMDISMDIRGYPRKICEYGCSGGFKGRAGGGRPLYMTECIVKPSKNFAPKCIISA